MKDYSFYSHEPAGMRKMQWIEQQLDRQAKIVGKESLRILDVGCGNGHLSAFMASRGHHVIGIDESEIAISSAKKQYQDVEFRVAHSLNAIGEFDVITAFEVCEHIPELDDFLSSIQDHLVDTGVFVISVPNGWSVEEHLRWFMQHTDIGTGVKSMLRRSGIMPKSNAQSDADSPHVHFLQWWQWTGFFRNAGFELRTSANVSLVFKQLYYILFRRFLSSHWILFQLFDRIDGKIVGLLPRICADGWLMVWNKRV